MPAAPNRLAVVTQMKNDFPQEFIEAHGNYPAPPGPERDKAERFIRRVAWALHQEDSRWGLNIKKMQANGRISQDAVAFKVGATIEVYDVIYAAGSTDPTQPARPTWNLVDEKEATFWEKPRPVTTPPPPTPDPEPEPEPEPCPDPVPDTSDVLARLEYLEALVAGHVEWHKTV